MNIITLLSSINKLILLAFLVILGFLIYEIISLFKENKPKSKVNVPKFKENMGSVTQAVPMVDPDVNRSSASKKTYFLIFALSFVLVFFGLYTLLGFSKSQNNTTKVNEPITQNNVTKSPTSKPSPTQATAEVASVTPELFPSQEITLGATLEISPTEEPTQTVFPSPTEIVLNNVSPTENIETTTPSPTQRVIASLPETGYIRNTILLLGISGTIILLSLIF